MGMTVEEHIAQLKKLKSFHNGSYGASINFALDTMRKYQKIQDLWNRCHVFDHDKYFRMIGQIIETGDIQIY